MTTAHIFVDANAALHFLRPDQLDWLRLTGADEVLFIAAPVFLREIENQKVHNPSKKLRARAAEYVKWLARFIDEPDVEVRPGVRWHFVAEEPLLDFAAHRLSPSIADDHLIASVLTYAPQSTGPVFVTTGDLGLKAKLLARRISPLFLTDDQRLSSEPDPEQKELQDLRREVARMKNRAPVLSLRFLNNRDHLEVTLTLVGAPQVQSVAEIQSEYPKLPVPGTRPRGYAIPAVHKMQVSMLRLHGWTSEQIIAYNEELERFYEKWAEHIEAVRAWENENRRRFAVNLLLVNVGTAPATDIDVRLAFPPGVTPLTDDRLPKRPTPPERPRSARGMATIGALMTMPVDVLDPRRLAPVGGDADGRPFAEADARYVDFSVHTLKHHREFTIDPFTLSFDSADNINSFEAEYEISLAEVPEVVRGKLRFVVNALR